MKVLVCLVRAQVRAWRRTGVGLAGVNVTPTLFINGRLLEGVRSYADYERIILQERERQAAPVSPPDS